ncbi:ATP-binding cassette sub-family A member 3, partial [Armadillidium nasatum]
MTGEEMLSLMAGLRGVSTRRDPLILRNIISLVGLAECANRPTSTFSGGNKRKLSTAMALVGQPSLIFLDEPTSGVDPASRRRVWEAIRSATRNGQSVILTSHSMDECESLCSKIIILATGVIRCVGTPKYLKAKYGKGYTLQIKIKSYLPKELLNTSIQSKEDEEIEYMNLIEELKCQITMLFPNCKLTDEYRLSKQIIKNVIKKMDPLGTGLAVV